MAKKFYSNYILAFKLTGLVGARIIEEENADGVMERGVFIPMEINNLMETEKHNVFVYGLVTELDKATANGGQSHYISQSTSPDHIQHLADMGYRIPYLGFMRRAAWHNKPKWQSSLPNTNISPCDRKDD